MVSFLFVPTVDEIRHALARYEPTLVAPGGHRRAAVAMILHEAAGRPEVLFIERAEHEGDPWSGHMAFPGGRVEPEDPDLRFAAERETLEEVGVDLAGAELLGQLDDLHGRRAAGVPKIVISAYVYLVPRVPLLATNHEVRAAFWFPLPDLHAPERAVPYRVGHGTDLEFPGILVGEPERHIVWGLTYRFLEVFFTALERPLPDRWSELPPGVRGDSAGDG